MEEMNLLKTRRRRNESVQFAECVIESIAIGNGNPKPSVWIQNPSNLGECCLVVQEVFERVMGNYCINGSVGQWNGARIGADVGELGTGRPLLGEREIHSNDTAAAYFVMKAAAAASKIEDKIVSFEAA